MSHTRAVEMELGIKVNRHAKFKSKPIGIGRFQVEEVSHCEWEVSTRDGQYLDTFSKREQAVRYAEALKAR